MSLQDLKGFVILQFGRPGYDGTHYGALGYSGDFINTSSIQAYIENYIQGFYSYSPNQVFLNVIVGITNQGSYLNFEHGQTWGTLVKNIGNWIIDDPADPYDVDYSGNVGVMGELIVSCYGTARLTQLLGGMAIMINQAKLIFITEIALIVLTSPLIQMMLIHFICLQQIIGQ